MKPIGDLCEIIGGGTPSKSNAAFFNGSIPWATVRDMKADWIEATEHSITPEAVKRSATNILPSGAVVIASRVGLGKICRVSKDTAINQDLRGFIPKPKAQLDIQYLFWWFKSVADQIVAAGNGATVQGVTLPFLRSLQIPIPPLDEQRRIVVVLDKAFAGIATATANAQKNQTNVRALFDSYLANSLHDEVGEWIERPFGECFRLKSGDGLTSSAMVNGPFPVFGGNGIAGYHNESNLTGENVIIGRVGALCGNARHVQEPIWLTDNAFKVAENRWGIDNTYLKYLLNFMDLRSYARQAAQPVISNSSLKDIVIRPC